MCFIKEGHKLGKIEPLFKRISEADVKVWKEKFGGVQNPTGDAGAAAADTKGIGDKKQAREKKPPREKKPLPSPPQSLLKLMLKRTRQTKIYEKKTRLIKKKNLFLGIFYLLNI